MAQSTALLQKRGRHRTVCKTHLICPRAGGVAGCSLQLKICKDVSGGQKRSSGKELLGSQLPACHSLWAQCADTVIKVEGGQFPTAPMRLDHAELWTEAIHLNKKGTQQKQDKSHRGAL